MLFTGTGYEAHVCRQLVLSSAGTMPTLTSAKFTLCAICRSY